MKDYLKRFRPRTLYIERRSSLYESVAKTVAEGLGDGSVAKKALLSHDLILKGYSGMEGL